MITIFSTFRSFSDPRAARIQRNAIRSWRQLGTSCEVILFGNEEGVRELAEEVHARHVSEVERGEQNLPLISALFTAAQELARGEILCYTNGDIILARDFLEGVAWLQRIFPSFLGIGRRWDLAIEDTIDFADATWESALKQRVRAHGVLHGPSGIDYHIFPRGQFRKLPPFVVGRGGWDNAVLFHARRQAIPLVDMTARITAIHQEYEEQDSPSRRERVSDAGALRNVALAGGRGNLLTIREAEWICDERGIRATPYPRRAYVTLSYLPLWRSIVGLYRTIRSL